MAEACQTRGIPSRKRPPMPPATRQRGLGQSGCGFQPQMARLETDPTTRTAGSLPPPTDGASLFATRRDREGAASHVLKPRRLATAPPWAPIRLSASASYQRPISGSKRFVEVPAIRERGVNAPADSRNHGADSGSLPFPPPCSPCPSCETCLSLSCLANASFPKLWVCPCDPCVPLRLKPVPLLSLLQNLRSSATSAVLSSVSL